ncbi:MAG: DUF1840 domain-containing protein [Burkholderiaceae bacterium]|nr:DUF1840 domain-containing protein [Burkholderiaceae bacterium]MCD8537976.1 DUF1840 domain-containing protein [Burkholderiaceae bacterium]MCD8564112.1 DUF1840 domain-containing protein [Burkholderiaceae bacterium]
MLVTFSSKVDADVLMMGDHAKLVLKAAGKDIGSVVPERGVFTPEQLGDAIANLEKAIAKQQPRPKDDEDDDEGKSKELVLLEQRAYPLLAMMRKAKEANAPVMWETGSGW